MLIDNILFLRERFPKVRKYFLEHEQDINSTNIEVIDSKSGQKTIRYVTDDEKGLMVHSMYNPVREAVRIIESHQDKIENDTHVFFYGIGLGYHIEKFKEMFPNNSYSLLEPVPEIFFSLTQHKLLKSVVSKNTKNLYLDTLEEESFGYLEEFNTSNKNIHLIILPSYENIVKKQVANFREKVRKVILNRRTGLHTSTNFQKLWVVNSIYNFKEVLNTPNMLKDIDRNHFAGKPAIIVSAGPSLAEDMEHIRFIKENNLAYIFSVGSAINSLIAHDVLPDAVCTYDPGKLNYKVFDKMIENNIKHIPMIFGSSVGYETLTKYHGPKVHFITTQDRKSIYFLREQLNIEQDLIMDSPSIAVMTFQLLNKLEAGPIIFAGQNLGYLNERLYAEGIEYDHIDTTIDKKKMDKAPITKDVYGNEIKTSIGFNKMRESIEQFAKLYIGKKFINTTKGGAAIEGVPFQPIEDVIETMLTQSINKEVWWCEVNNYDKSNLKYHQEKLKASISDLYSIIDQIEKLLNSIATHTKFKSKLKLESSLTQFDILYSQLIENTYYKNFLSFYIRVQVEYMVNGIKRLNMERDPFIKGKEIVQLFHAFLKHCKHSGKELEQIIVD